VRADFRTTARDIAAACHGRISAGSADTIIDSISSDSRDTGDRCLFIPLEGERFDGHDFIRDLIAGHAVSAVLSRRDGFEEAAASHNVTVIRCDDTLAALGAIASSHRGSVRADIVAITGTNGKTTTKELLHAVLSPDFSTHKNEKNYNNEIGVPFAVMGLEASHEKAVFELGMNHPGEISRLSKMVRPSMAVITNAGEGHLEFLGSVENVARAKMEIIDGMKPGSLLFLNRDSQCFELMKDIAEKGGFSVRTFGLGDDAMIRPSAYRLGRDSLELSFGGDRLSVPLYGIHNVYNVLAVTGVALECGISLSRINSALSAFSNVDGRSQIIDRGYVIINDTYNSNPLSSRTALQSAAAVFPERRKVAVLSDMKELGEAAPGCHRNTGAAVARNSFDLLCLWGDMASEYMKGALDAGMDRAKVMSFDTKKDLSDYLRASLTPSDVVLVKGSRSMKMEDVVRALTE
jgi:UDP-N-acetylmuramoyl-tripeptide--D-alanyl-D-alanine ligase